MKLNIAEVIVRVKVLQDKKTKAIISLDFGDFVVKGFRVQESKYPNSRGDMLWLTPPAYPGGGRYHPIFFTPDKGLWEALSEKIWDEYSRQSDETNRKFYGVDEDIWASL